MAYYIAIDGVQQGPFELHDLRSKGMRADSLVWTEGMPDWKRADSVPEVAAMLAGPATPQGAQPVVPTPAPMPYMGGTLPTAHPGVIGYQTRIGAPTNGFATASMVLGIVAFPLIIFHCMGTIPAILAIIFGFIAHGKVRRHETEVGKGMALAGIILGFGYFGLILFFLSIALIFVAARHR